MAKTESYKDYQSCAAASGSWSAGTLSAGGSRSSSTIYFNRNFSSAPAVTVQSAYASCVATAQGVTSNGFQVTCYNAGSSSVSAVGDWTAVGPVSS